MLFKNRTYLAVTVGTLGYWSLVTSLENQINLI